MYPKIILSEQNYLKLLKTMLCQSLISNSQFGYIKVWTKKQPGWYRI